MWKTGHSLIKNKMKEVDAALAGEMSGHMFFADRYFGFDDATYEKTSASFENADFVEVVIHSYRHRYGLVPGDPAVEKTEQLLIAQPQITVPTVVLHGEGNGVSPADGSEHHHKFFTAAYERRVIPSVGHNIPQEAPHDFAEAVLSVAQYGRV